MIYCIFCVLYEFPFERGDFIRVIESFSMVGGHEIYFQIDMIICVLETDNQGNLLAFQKNWKEDQWIAAKYFKNFKQVDMVNWLYLLSFLTHDLFPLTSLIFNFSKNLSKPTY
jgi:hypothetical protein